MILFHDKTGPLVTYSYGFFRADDLNPESHVRWRMSRREMFVFGLRTVWAAIFAA